MFNPWVGKIPWRREKHKASLIAQSVKNLPAIQETWVQSLGWENLLEKGLATHSSILAWTIPWTEKPGGLQPKGSQRLGTTEQITHTRDTRVLH